MPVNADQEVMKVQKVHQVHLVSKDHPVLTVKREPAVKRVTKVSYSAHWSCKLMIIFQVNVVWTVHQVSPDLKVHVVKSVFVVSLVLVVMPVRPVNPVTLVFLVKMVARVNLVSFSIMWSLEKKRFNKSETITGHNIGFSKNKLPTLL